MKARSMKRRSFLFKSSLAAAVVATSAVGWRRWQLAPAPMSALIDELDALRTRELRGTGAWSPYRVFTHLSQSVDYSLRGYPSMKPGWFTHSVGPAAFFAFETAGAMHHGLDEPIPGAPAIAADGDAPKALSDLIASLERFIAHQGALHPHFAYGALSKAEFAHAHVLHVRDHLGEIALA